MNNPDPCGMASRIQPLASLPPPPKIQPGTRATDQAQACSALAKGPMCVKHSGGAQEARQRCPIRKEGTLRPAVGYPDLDYGSGPGMMDRVTADPGERSNNTRNTTEARDWLRNNASHHQDQCGQARQEAGNPSMHPALAVQVSLTWSPDKGWSAFDTREAQPFRTPDGLQPSCNRWRRNTHISTDGHGDSVTESAQLGCFSENPHWRTPPTLNRYPHLDI